MAENLISTCDWIKLRGKVGEHLAELLTILLDEKGITVPELLVVTGGTLTNQLPTASDDQAGLAGSLNVISTHIGFTTNYMTDFAKLQKDFTQSIQAAFIHGLNLLSQLHYGVLPLQTYYLTLSCDNCTQEIQEDHFAR